MTLEQHNERLTMQKNQLQNALQGYSRILAALVKTHGTEKNDLIEYRVTKAKLDKVRHVLNIRPLGNGGLVLELHPPPE